MERVTPELKRAYLAPNPTPASRTGVLVFLREIPTRPGDPGSLKQFEAAQSEMGSALSRLLVVTENYPQLKSDQNFRELQAELAGTENRITVARKR